MLIDYTRISGSRSHEPWPPVKDVRAQSPHPHLVGTDIIFITLTKKIRLPRGWGWERESHWLEFEQHRNKLLANHALEFDIHDDFVKQYNRFLLWGDMFFIYKTKFVHISHSKNEGFIKWIGTITSMDIHFKFISFIFVLYLVDMFFLKGWNRITFVLRKTFGFFRLLFGFTDLKEWK